jgi:hypothetical protein
MGFFGARDLNNLSMWSASQKSRDIYRLKD